MRIKRVEVIGFKSFCDRATINVDAQVIAVVGPNGCGKSNIVDAIRWCMGEQSAKHLRGKSMEDVIFAGSESRGPAPMAEVSLTFDEVGFSHETLSLALHSDEAQAARALEEIDATPERDPESWQLEGNAGNSEAGNAESGSEGDLAAAESGADTSALTRDGDGEPMQTAFVQTLAAARLVASPDAAEGASTLLPDGAAVSAAGDVAVGAQAVADVRDFLAEQEQRIDFSQFSEVTITRRLFRDGTSQYFINKTPCRLRDITDFFLGTGVGTKAYAIIEQGRIGQVVSSRPVDRRTIIEEAAGITKFKVKKKAAERKLEQTKQNLLRVSDIVSELDKRMGTLRRQAQKAERYRTYKTQVRDLELCKAAHRYLELRAEESLVTEGLATGKVALDDARASWSIKDARVVAERAELVVEERRLTQIQEAVYELDNQLGLMDSKSQFQRRESTELSARATAAATEADELDGSALATEEELTQRQGELVELLTTEDRAKQEAERADLTARELRAEVDDAQRMLDRARADLAELRGAAAATEARAGELGRRREEAERRRARVEEDIGNASERSRELEREVRRVDSQLTTARQTRLDLGNQSEGFAARSELLAEDVARLEAQVETLRTELHRRKSRLQSLLELQQRYEGFARGTRAVMQREGALADCATSIHGLVADVVRAPQTLEVAVEAALGERLGGVLVDGAAVGARAIAYLKTSGGGRSTFVAVNQSLPTDRVGTPMSAADVDVTLDGSHSIVVDDRIGLTAAAAAAAHEQRGEGAGAGVVGRMADLLEFADGYGAVGQALLGEHVVVDNLDHALSLHSQGVTETLVTLDGDVVDPRGVVSGGSREDKGAGVLAQKREIRELEEIVAALEHDLAEASAQLVTARTELKQVTKAIEGLRHQVHQGELEIVGHEKDSGRVRGELERLRERLDQLGAEQIELTERLNTIANDEQTLAVRRAESVARIGELEGEQLGMIERLTAGRERFDVASTELTAARVASAAAAEKRASAAASEARLTTTLRDLRARVQRLREDSVAGSARSDELIAMCAQLEEEAAELRRRRTAEAEQLDAGRTAYELRLTELTTVELEARELRSRSEQLGGEVAQLELRFSQIAMNQQTLLASVEERHQVELSSVVCDYHLRPQIGAEGEEKLIELRGLIDRMGTDINLTAIDEFAEVSQRHEFLSRQQIDLDDAVGQLDRAIDKINKTSRRLFKETFHAVNNTFKKVFPRLFRGGQAHLSLTGGEDVDLLEAGVEIMAQPPGKKNSTVDQLSGGEKALTAVALIFSIFLIKPSPFCILDEVDAPLDEANVDRYNEIVREMTDRSQFIIISHNKRTMEAADRLYGVTMKEPGVSMLVSVNLARVGQSAA